MDTHPATQTPGKGGLSSRTTPVTEENFRMKQLNSPAGGGSPRAFAGGDKPAQHKSQATFSATFALPVSAQQFVTQRMGAPSPAPH